MPKAKAGGRCAASQWGAFSTALRADSLCLAIGPKGCQLWSKCEQLSKLMASLGERPVRPALPNKAGLGGLAAGHRQPLVASRSAAAKNLVRLRCHGQATGLSRRGISRKAQTGGKQSAFGLPYDKFRAYRRSQSSPA